MTMGMMPEPGQPTTSHRPRRIGRWIALAIVLVVCAGAVVASLRSDRGRTIDSSTTPLPALVMDTSATAPGSVRIRVRVLNATTTKGLAKRATFLLRDYGYDVVDYDGGGEPRATTLIVSHTGHADWAARLQRALGTGVTEARVDTLRYVDFTVLLGSDWKPPAQAFRP